MYCKLEKFLRCSLFALTALMMSGNKDAFAQGVVTLSDDALPNLDSEAEPMPMPAPAPAPAPSATDGSALFEEDVDSLISPPVRPSLAATPAPAVPPPAMLPAAEVQPLPIIEEEVVIAAPVEVAPAPRKEVFAEDILNEMDNDLFSQMSNLEKQTTLLNLEFRREKAKTEIEALRATRQKALDEEAAIKEEAERKRVEWENEQARKLVVEEQKVIELTTAFEKVRQERLLKIYKNTLLEENQRWIEGNERLFESVKVTENEKDDLVNLFKGQMGNLSALAERYQAEAKSAKENHDREILSLNNQIAILKSRLEAAETEKAAKGQDNKDNPFADKQSLNKKYKLSDEYVIVEIRGQGEDVMARIKNVLNGVSFMAKAGTVLQSGHMIDEITRTQVRAEKDGVKDYIYFTAGGVIDTEPSASPLEEDEANGKKDNKGKKNGNTEVKSSRSIAITDGGLPSLADGMFAK